MSCVACDGAVVGTGRTADGALVRCRSCGTRRIEIEPTASARAYGAAYRDAADPHKLARLVELFESHSGAAGRVLDVGCGDGGFLAEVAARGWAVHGLDLDPGAVAAARARSIATTFGAAPETDCPGSFDVITLWDVIEHVRDPAATARWLARLVAPGGRIVVLTPDAGSLFDRIAAIERAATRGRSSRVEQLCLNRYHLHRFTSTGIARLFALAGFRAVTIQRLQLFSLHADRYLSGFAPGISGFSQQPRLDAALSRIAFAIALALRVTNKLLYVGERR